MEKEGPSNTWQFTVTKSTTAYSPRSKIDDIQSQDVKNIQGEKILRSKIILSQNFSYLTVIFVLDEIATVTPIAIGIVYNATEALKTAPKGKNSKTSICGIEKPIG